ncbi:MAG: phosphotransferase [Candidatus Pacebacteria bacterium]|nr:phosphotransferase [Candidatus Paceibacterota bacterium]
MLSLAEINQICKKEGIVFKKIIRTSNRFVLVLGEEKKQDAVLKILRDARRNFAKIALKKEIAVLKLFNNLKTNEIGVPQLFGYNLSAKHPYYKEEYVNGGILEEKEGFFFKNLKSKEIKKLSKIVSFLNKIKSAKIKKIPNLADFGKNYIDFFLRFHKSEIKNFLDKNKAEKFFNLIEKAKKILVPEKLTVIHGEVYPNNLMENKAGKIFLLDWENIGIGNIAHDAVSVYLRIKERANSELFLKNLNFKDQKYFQLFFQLEIIMQSLGSASYFKNKKELPENFRKESISYFLNAISRILGDAKEK